MVKDRFVTYKGIAKISRPAGVWQVPLYPTGDVGSRLRMQANSDIYAVPTSNWNTRLSSSPESYPNGVGGTTNTIWLGDDGGFGNTGTIYELSPSDFSVVSSAASPNTAGFGTGGDGSTIWHCDYDSDKVYELDSSDFSVVRSAGTLTDPYGIGGDAKTIWACTNPDVYELSTTDLTTVRSTGSPNSDSYGIGGTGNTIWHTSGFTDDQVSEMLPSDLSVRKTHASPTITPWGMGGDDNTVWHSELENDRVYELMWLESTSANVAGEGNIYGVHP